MIILCWQLEKSGNGELSKIWLQIVISVHSKNGLEKNTSNICSVIIQPIFIKYLFHTKHYSIL